MSVTGHAKAVGHSFLVIVVVVVLGVQSEIYSVDPSKGLNRRFDGIGGISGGGATSKLLMNYAEPYRSQILDYLFKPNFGASLQILKVEIGGDSQSTEGTESSHMHEPWDESYDRGYEWWLMVEAKKRNPAIKLYGLPWAYPGWLGSVTPYDDNNATALYVTKWILAAKNIYSLDIDYVGIWNERTCQKEYVMVLRDVLDQHGLNQVQIVVADGTWGVAVDVMLDKKFAQVVDYIGVHYPGCKTPLPAINTGKQLWASEDYSTFNDAVGAGCWARILNQNYVLGMMTSTISWNLVASYYQALPFGRDGLMTAQEPWSGHYKVELPIWVTAHTTHYTEPGWHYLYHGSGVGKLLMGGSYVSLMDPNQKQFTMIIETMSHDHSVCIRPFLRPYNTSPQNATFKLQGKLASIKTLYIWFSRLRFDGKPSEMFEPMGTVQLTGGSFTLHLDVDVLITLTTIERDPPKLYPASPASQEFPLPYTDDYEAYPLNSEAFNFVPQVGVWEVRQVSNKHGKVNRQVMLNPPCYWCDTGSFPLNIGGNYNWSDLSVSVDVNIPSVNGTQSVVVASRVTKGGCGIQATTGVFLRIHINSRNYTLTKDLGASKVLLSGSLPTKIAPDTWYRLTLVVQGNKTSGYLDGSPLFKSKEIIDEGHGFVGFGTVPFGLADFDNLSVTRPPKDVWNE